MNNYSLSQLLSCPSAPLEIYSQFAQRLKANFSPLNSTISVSRNPLKDKNLLTFMPLMLRVTVVFYTLTKGASINLLSKWNFGWDTEAGCNFYSVSSFTYC